MNIIKLMVCLLLVKSLWATNTGYELFEDKHKQIRVYEQINTLTQEATTHLLYGAAQVATSAALSYGYFGKLNPFNELSSIDLPHDFDGTPEAISKLPADIHLRLLDDYIESQQNLVPVVFIASIGLHGFWTIAKGSFKFLRIAYKSTTSCLQEAQHLKKD